MGARRLDLTNVASRDVRGRRLRPGPPAGRVRGSLFRILGETGLCAMATVSGDRRAHVNTAYFCFSGDLVLYFLSHPASRHCRNLAANPSMAVAVFASGQEWTRPGRGVQLFGSCRPAKGTDLARAERLYARRFGAYRAWKAALGSEAAGRDYSFYRFVPDRVKILDEGALGDAVFASAKARRSAAHVPVRDPAGGSRPGLPRGPGGG